MSAHNASAFDKNLALRLSQLMDDKSHFKTTVSNQRNSSSPAACSQRSSSSPEVKIHAGSAEDAGTCLDTKQQQRSSDKSKSAILSRPTLFAAAARVIKERDHQRDADQPMSKTEMRAKLQIALRHPPQLQAVVRGLSHLFVELQSGMHFAGTLTDRLLFDEGAGRRDGMRIVALEGWAQLLSHEIAVFNQKPFSFHERDRGAAAHEDKALFDTLVEKGKPLLQRSQIAAAGCSSHGAAAAAAWLEALIGDDAELVERCVRTMPVLVTMLDGSACSALHVAASSGSSRAIRFLLSQGASLWSRDCWGRLPFHALFIGAALSEYALRRVQAKTTFVHVFNGVIVDARIPRNDDVSRIISGRDHGSCGDNCWLRCLRRMLQYAVGHTVYAAVCKDDKGFSCAQYAAAADAVMQLGILQLLLQSAVEDGGITAGPALLQHRQQLQLMARCVGHAEALQFVTAFLDQLAENEKEDTVCEEAQPQLRRIGLKQLSSSHEDDAAGGGGEGRAWNVDAPCSPAAPALGLKEAMQQLR
jgi:hypothetical protein